MYQTVGMIVCVTDNTVAYTMVYHFSEVPTTVSLANEHESFLEWLFVCSRVNDVNYTYRV